MIINKSWLKYLSPFFGILFCPVTILFLWTIWSEPGVNSQYDDVEEILP
tara:strand:- start:111 stop:257 length:147 start_codon:yes stop_codon:yes gene_type:complete